MSPEEIKPYDSHGVKGEQVEQMFDSIAHAYDFMNSAMTFGLHRYWRNRALKRVARRFEKDGTHNILDVACGTGDVTFHLAKEFPNASLTGIDLSEGMLAVANEKLAKMDADTRRCITFQSGDCLKLPYNDGAFDVVTVAYGVRNFADLKAGYAEMLRVLKPGGMLCVIELSVPRVSPLRWGYNLYSRRLIPAIGKMVSGDSRAYTYLPESIAACPQRDDMTALMSEVGFQDCSWNSLTFGTVCIYCGLKA